MQNKKNLKNIFPRIPFKSNKNIYRKINGILINEITISEYQNLYLSLDLQNISHIQTPGYYPQGNEYCYLKIFIDNRIIGIVSILKKGFCFNLIKIARINNGPLICKKFEKYKYFILIKLLQHIKNNYAKIVSFCPPSIFTYEKKFKSFNIIRLNLPQSKTYIINLQNEEEELIKSLRSNWRNGLKKGLKFTIVKEIKDTKFIKNILLDYQNYSKKLNFKPISNERCLEWFNNYKEKNKLLNLKIFQATKSDDQEIIVGSIGILYFKNKALYLFGFTTNLGKKYQANSSLLWHAILDSKKAGLREFDLGGFNSNTTIGIKKFKEGLNGRLIESLGEYIYIGIF